MTPFQHEVLNRLKEFAPVYLVGGAVRDPLLGFETKDTDVVTELPLEAIEKHLVSWGFHPLRIGAKHPTITLFHEGQRLDFTSFSGDLESDALRRDFTINAIYQSVQTGEYIDPLGGWVDLQAKRLRACGTPEDCYQEDPVRILRFVRLKAKYGLSFEEKTFRAAQASMEKLASTASERITEELGKILVLPNIEDGIRLLDELGYWQTYIPELARLKGLVQNQYHAKDAWEHTLHVIRNTPPQIMLRLAGLFHDIGKWETASRECYAWGKLISEPEGFRVGEFRILGRQIKRWNAQWVEVHGARLDHYPDIIQVKHLRKANSGRVGFEWVTNGKRHFLGHEKESARLTRQILPRFRFSMLVGSGPIGERELLWLIENHMSATLTFISELRGEGHSNLGEKARRFAWQQGWDGRNYRQDRLFLLLDLWRADFFGGKKRGPQDEEIFEQVQQAIRVEAIKLKERGESVDWGPLEEFARGKGLSGKDFGDFKERVRTVVLLNERSQVADLHLLEQEYRSFRRKP